MPSTDESESRRVLFGLLRCVSRIEWVESEHRGHVCLICPHCGGDKPVHDQGCEFEAALEAARELERCAGESAGEVAVTEQCIGKLLDKNAPTLPRAEMQDGINALNTRLLALVARENSAE